jgi:hypothetical protein
MKRSPWLSRFLKVLISLSAGGTLIGTSCGEDLRNTVRAAGLDFVKSSSGTALQTFIPIKDILAGLQTPST